MKHARINPDERDRLIAMMARMPIGEVERVSGRSIHTLYRLVIADRGKAA